MNQPTGDLERRQKLDPLTIVLTVVAAVLAFWPMSGALFSLWALGSEQAGKGGDDAPFIAFDTVLFVLPILGGLLAWAQARRRYRFARIWRRTAVGVLTVSAGIDVLALAWLALWVVAGLRAR